jgi:RES domain-containing protein
MTTLWRISNYPDLGGEGGRIASARWHTEGRPVVYLAESPAAAMLERIVHLSYLNGKLPRTYDLLEVEAAENLPVLNLDPSGESEWKQNAEITRALGDDWLAASASAMARVPSVIVPLTWNFLLNPLHPDASKVRIVSVIRERFDNRLFQSEAR